VQALAKHHGAGLAIHRRKTWTVGIVYTRYPFRWPVSPVDTRPSGPYLYSWVEWSNVSEVSCSRVQ